MSIIIDLCKRAFLPWTIFLLSTQELSAQNYEVYRQGAGIIQAKMILPKEKFDFSSIELISRKFIGDFSSKVQLYTLKMGTDWEDLDLYLGRLYSGSRTNEEYEEWILGHGWPKTPVARVIGIKQQAILSYRDSTEMKEKILLGSNDPTLFRIANVDYRLLHFHFVDSGELFSSSYRYHLSFYFRGPSDKSHDNYLNLTKQMARLTGTKNVQILIHGNSWINNDEFPLFYPFVRELTFPCASDCSIGADVFCGESFNKPAHCKRGSMY